MGKVVSTLIVAGVAGVVATSFYLPEVKDSISLFSVNSSPYGKLLATTYGRPVDLLDHNGRTHSHGKDADEEEHHHDEGCGCGECGHDHQESKPEAKHQEGCGCGECDHDHDHEHEIEDDCEACKQQLTQKKIRLLRQESQKELGQLGNLAVFLGKMDDQLKNPTNHLGVSSGQYVWARRTLEQTVKTAYNLDPLNYTHFNSLYFFYSVPVTVARIQRTDNKKVLDLCYRTIAEIKKDPENPVGWLTVASAYQGILLRMVREPKNYTRQQAQEIADGMKNALEMYKKYSKQRLDEGNWVVGSKRYVDILNIATDMTVAFKMIEKLPEVVEWKSA